MAIETVFLDAGGVLVYPNWSRVSETLTRYGIQVSVDALWQGDAPARFILDEGYRVATSTDADRGSLFMNMVLDKAGVPRSPARDTALAELYAYHMEHNLWEHVPDDVVPALERLSALGVKLAIASNANGVLQRAFDRVGLTRFFRAICDSCIEGVEKPDPRFFRIVLERAGARPESTIHVGDLYHVDVVGARNSGLGAVLLDPHDLYAAYDADRIRSLSELVERIENERAA